MLNKQSFEKKLFKCKLHVKGYSSVKNYSDLSQRNDINLSVLLSANWKVFTDIFTDS